MQKLPDFFLVGAPKCATATLSDWLDQHSDIHVLQPREPNFFGTDLEMQVRHFNSIDEYLAAFQPYPDKLCGEGSTWYLYSQTAAQEIFEVNPQAKILMILRNPVEVVPSLHNYRVYYGNETETDLEAVLAREERALKQWRASGIGKDVMQIYLDVARYHAGVNRYLERFGSDQVMIILFDELKSQPDKLVERVFQFLEVDSDFRPEQRKKNESGTYKSDAVRRLLHQPSDGLRKIARMLPQSWRHKIGSQLRRANTNYGEKSALPAQLEQQLRDALRPDVDKLEQLLQRDLSAWRSSSVTKK